MRSLQQSKVFSAATVAVLALASSVRLSSALDLDLGQSKPNLSTPGLSGSFDYSEFESIKEPLTKNLLRLINNMTLPDLNFDGNIGYMRDNKLFVQQKADSIIFIPNEAENSLLFQISNIVADMSVNQFAYTKLLVPIKGFLKVRMQGIFLRVKIKFSKVIAKDGRILPQIQLTESKFELDTRKIQFDLGGDLLLDIADFMIPILRGFFREPLEKAASDQIRIFPNKFNQHVIKTNGFFNLGFEFPAMFPKGSPYSTLTLDYSLEEDLKVSKNKILFGINGTFFNNDKGYHVPPIKQAVMPMFDPTVPGKFQLFISNYMMESLAWAFLEKQPFSYRMEASVLDNSIAPFDTTTFEGIFPFLTSRFGKKIPTDLVLRVKRVWDVTCKEDERNTTHKIGRISMKMDLETECIIIYPKGENKSVGYAEYRQTEFDTRIIQVNMTNFTVVLLRGNVTEQYLHTNYIGSFKSSTYIINTALMFLLEWLNEAYFLDMTVDLQNHTLGLFKWNQSHLGYNDGYLSFGFTLDFRNSSLFDEKKLMQQQNLDWRPEWVEAEAMNQRYGEERLESNRAFLGGTGVRWIEADGVRYYLEDEEVRRASLMKALQS